MEISSSITDDQRKMGSNCFQRRQKGGLITMPFIIANEALEKVASYGLLPNMILYFLIDYKMSVAKGTNVLFFWTSASNFTPIVGAFLADSYLGRFATIALGSLFSLLGMILLWLTTMIPALKPAQCDPTKTGCNSSTSSSQFAFLCLSLILMSIGAGGIRTCSLAFGADQFYKKDDPGNKKVIESFFGWYYVSATVAVLIALTGIVYIQDHLGWRIGFGVPAILMFLAGILFIFASPLFIKMKATSSLFTGFAQVIAASFKNRKLAHPPRNADGWYHHVKDSELILPSNKLRFLNKACIIRSPEHDIKLDGSASNPWSLCTIDQVEELKAVLKVIPIWSSSIMMSINISQNTFQLLQARSMDRHIGSGFQIPAGSFGMFTIIAMAVWIVLYDRAILPLASKLKGRQVRLGTKLRMGIGLFFSCLAMVVSGIVENIRRKKAIDQGFLNNPVAVVNMSAMWLVPQYTLNGLAEAFNAIGQTEFYYMEFPKSMSSIASSMFGLGMAVANLLAIVILSTVNNITSRGGKQSWVSTNINKGHYDNYYWLLAIMSVINLAYFMVCSWAYGPCVEQGTRVSHGQNESEECDEESKLQNGDRTKFTKIRELLT